MEQFINIMKNYGMCTTKEEVDEFDLEMFHQIMKNEIIDLDDWKGNEHKFERSVINRLERLCGNFRVCDEAKFKQQLTNVFMVSELPDWQYGFVQFRLFMTFPENQLRLVFATGIDEEVLMQKIQVDEKYKQQRLKTLFDKKALENIKEEITSEMDDFFGKEGIKRLATEIQKDIKIEIKKTIKNIKEPI